MFMLCLFLLSALSLSESQNFRISRKIPIQSTSSTYSTFVQMIIKKTCKTRSEIGARKSRLFLGICQTRFWCFWFYFLTFSFCACVFYWQNLPSTSLGAHPSEALSPSANWMYSCRERLCIVTERFFRLECWVCFRWPYSWFSTKTSLTLAGNNLTKNK